MSVDPVAGDQLTRTTLAVGGEFSPTHLAALIAVLQRVPGVLFAEPVAGGALVAHDAAVSGPTLVAAAARAGMNARVARDTRALPESVLAIARGPLVPPRRFFAIAGGLLLVVALGDIFFPRLRSNGFVLPLLLSLIWAFVIARAVIAHRK